MATDQKVRGSSPLRRTQSETRPKGGLFGTYVLLHEPTLFKKVLLASPLLWWEDFSSVKSIFLSVEEIAKDTPLEIGSQLESFSLFRSQFLHKKPDTLKFKSIILPDEDQMTLLPSPIMKGIKFYTQ